MGHTWIQKDVEERTQNTNQIATYGIIVKNVKELQVGIIT